VFVEAREFIIGVVGDEGWWRGGETRVKAEARWRWVVGVGVVMESGGTI
jgi:hypothetical protein